MGKRSKASTDAIRALRKLDHVRSRNPYPMREQEADNLEKLVMALTSTTTLDDARAKVGEYRAERKAEGRAQAQAQAQSARPKKKKPKPAKHPEIVRSVYTVSGGLPGQGKRN